MSQNKLNAFVAKISKQGINSQIHIPKRVMEGYSLKNGMIIQVTIEILKDVVNNEETNES